MKTSLSKAAAAMGRIGGKASGKAKRRGGKTRAEQLTYYKRLGLLSAAARKAKREAQAD